MTTNPLLPTLGADLLALTIALRHDWVDEDTAANTYTDVTGGELTDWYPVADDLVARGLLVRRVASTVAGLPAYTEVAATPAGAWRAGALPHHLRPEPDPETVSVRAVLRVTFDALMDVVRGGEPTGENMAALADDFRAWAAQNAGGLSLPAAVDAYAAATAERVAAA